MIGVEDTLYVKVKFVKI